MPVALGNRLGFAEMGKGMDLDIEEEKGLTFDVSRLLWIA